MRLAKRALDVIGAVTLLIVAAPVMLAAAVAIAVTMGRPVLFRQKRGGYRGSTFVVNKFRTMNNARSATGDLLPPAQRLTTLGHLLRRLSIDELPQLWNVLCGDMSLIGPRPLLASYLPRYSRTQARRHEVRPGITGWAQVCGRDSLTWERKFELDVWYVDHWSLWLDLKIVIRTVWIVVSGRGNYETGYPAEMRFCGSQGTDSHAIYDAVVRRPRS